MFSASAEWSCNDCSFDDQRVRACYGGQVDIEVAGSYLDTGMCPVRWLSDHSSFMRVFDYAAAVKHHGMYPRRGGLDDQPGATMQAVNIVLGEWSRIERYEAEMELQRARRGK